MNWSYNRTYRERFYFATAIRGVLSTIRERSVSASSKRET
jgi:hypothetical protein